MNRSYSKIRHIQESNLRLEKNYLSEQVNTQFNAQQVYDDLSNSSSPFGMNTDKFSKTLMAITNQQQFDAVNKIGNVLELADKVQQKEFACHTFKSKQITVQGC